METTEVKTAWSATIKYQSADRKVRTGLSVIRDGDNQFICRANSEIAPKIVGAVNSNDALLLAAKHIIGWVDAGCDPTKKSIEDLRKAVTQAETVCKVERDSKRKQRKKQGS